MKRMEPDDITSSEQDQALDEAADAKRSPLRDFLRGAALIFDFDGGLSRRRISTNRYATDAEALASDWHAVGRDLRRSMGSHPPDKPKAVRRHR